MANILLITYYFPPRNSIPCRRVYAWAKYLKKIGHNVMVLTADSPGDEAINSFNVDLSGLEIYRLKYFDILCGLMKVFKPSDFFCADKEVKNKKSWHICLAEKIFNPINAYFSSKGILFGCTRFPTFFEHWFLRAYKQAKQIIKDHAIDVVITSSPPPTINLIGLYLKRKFKNILWLADHRDLWVDNPAHKGMFPFSILENHFEKKCIAASDVLTVVSACMVKKLSEKYPVKQPHIFCIENGYDEDLLETISRDKPFQKESVKTIVYSGTLYANRRSPEPLFKAIERDYDFFKNKIKIVFYGNYETRRILNKFSNIYPRHQAIIEYGGFLSSADILKKENEADALLFIENDKFDDGVYSGKIFEYMMFEKPIICVGINPGSSIGNMLEKTGLCFFCGDDIMKLEEVLRLLVNDNKINVSPDREYIKTFSRRSQVENLSAIIESYLNHIKR
ncbi:MAG: glycosyltransferase [Candidatus Omnitrophota bacterium]|jgi:glycosyltransferase involved in cell wall biosynthesis